ncbi:Importin subunit alpha-1 [Amphibalanus amphitrite]|uniref:Importin subunit alpha-1 n=1 Tax=Amphibalanus amphitrite TaxID=1232801 RepID=A0A6A4VQF3_AMPAM|nr:Importin subunit alpha-1 [Amphibalanus amphitrite]
MEELLAARSRLRTKATKACNDLRAYREGDRKALDPDQLALKLHHVEKIQTELQGLQVQLDKLGQADETDHVQTLEDEAFLGSRLLARLEKAEEAQFRTESMKAAGSADLKSYLTVAIPTFDGDVMRWPEFWELFLISVHDNPGYANVQRFVVLKSHLAGAALRAIQGIPVTGDGYVQAVSALKARFDLENVRRETLLKELMNMSSVRHGDLKAMRSFIDHLSAHTRALSTLGVSSESLSSLLLPMVKGNIPEDWRLEWARRSSHHFDDFLVFLKEEIRKDDYRSQREAVRVMVILNLTSGGSQERMAELCRLGAAKPRCDLLVAGGANLIMVFMDAPSNVLRCAEQVDREGTVALQVDECGGLDRIESLQTYEDEPSSSSAGTSTMTTGRTLRWRRPPPPPMASS